MLETVGIFGRHSKVPAAAGSLEHARRMQHGIETERTVFFSDAVFAIAMTLLALVLKLPELPAEISRHGYDQALLARVPSLAAFILSFVLVGRIWMTHHRRFSGIRAYDGKLQVLNLLLLFFVVFLPVPASILFKEAANSP
ncbi:TMEM175 family protein [Arthrobacter sp. H35-D1]|uniref:TMEM175 family protein n=1 Tax=Arthrobacter sp. H35-D1 TaxID=3046202 RepID=UPI0024B8D252|nr:TMEM175 family protein [Arthrobacter sp. H35-D1]MDJ0312215.1 TMEM175 family protein [Arthrobacter sp. H35-D1]